MRCPYCNEEHPDIAVFCPNTGLPISATRRRSSAIYIIFGAAGFFVLVVIFIAFTFLFNSYKQGKLIFLPPFRSPAEEAGLPKSPTEEPNPSENPQPQETDQVVTVENKSTVTQPVLPPTVEFTPGVATAPPLKVETDVIRDQDGMVMVYVPVGEFSMGANAGQGFELCQNWYSDCQRNWYEDEAPVHIVSLDSFWIDRTEVTNEMYAKCVTEGVCNPPDSVSSNARTSYFGNPEFDDYPVVKVSWYDANIYCRWVDARLPTEAEWEKAARGNDGRFYPWGMGESSMMANYGIELGNTSAVGSFQQGASPYGVMDMAGNVWEWVADWYDASYYNTSPVENPHGPVSGETRVLRGGSWSNYNCDVRCASRVNRAPDFSNQYIGFRCAR